MEEAKFTKEQYENGEAFRFLDEIEDETVRMIQRNRIAKELGVKDFNSLYKEHRKQLQAKKNATSATRFTGQTPLKCGSYQCDITESARAKRLFACSRYTHAEPP